MEIILIKEIILTLHTIMAIIPINLLFIHQLLSQSIIMSKITNKTREKDFHLNKQESPEDQNPMKPKCNQERYFTEIKVLWTTGLCSQI